MDIVEFAKKMHLIKVLFDGGILYKDHHGDSSNREFLFCENFEDLGESNKNKFLFAVRGWGTAFGSANERAIEVILKPELWKIHNRKVSNGYPYPWSANYKEKNNGH